MTTCGCQHEDDFAALAELDEEEAQPDASPDPRGNMLWRWSGLIAPYGVPTGDGRRFAVGALSNRDLPLPVKWQRTDSQGHSTSVVVATMDGLEYTDEGVRAWGVWLDPDPAVLPRLAEDVAEARLLTERKAIGPSVDLDDMEFHPIGDPGELAVGDGRPEVEVTRGRISAITLVQIPAFAEARPFTLDQISADDYAAQTSVTASGVRDDLAALPVAVGAEWDPLDWLLSDGDGALYEADGQALFPVAAITASGVLSLVPAAVADSISLLAFHGEALALDEGAKSALRFQLEQLAEVCDLPAPPWVGTQALTAAGLPAAVPAALFDNPRFAEPTPLRVEQVGEHLRVSGHLATWRTCHTGSRGTCITAPRSRSEYAYFHVGSTPTDRGVLPTGKITLGGGHADTSLGFQAAVQHYDDVTTAVADVRVGEDAHGIWFSGPVRPGLDEARLRELAASPLSGDWRRIGGGMELVAALAVNTPGFPVPHSHRTGGRELALVAAGAMMRDDEDEMVSREELRRRRKKRMRDDDHDMEYAAEDPAAEPEAAEEDLEPYFASLDHEARMEAARERKANPDGSYPIRNVVELRKAIQAYGRASDPAQTKRLIMRRARELDRIDLIPEQWMRDREAAGAASLSREVSAVVLADTIEAEFASLRQLDAARLAELF